MINPVNDIQNHDHSITGVEPICDSLLYTCNHKESRELLLCNWPVQAASSNAITDVGAEWTLHA
jgi:hypothetical protein